MDVRLDEKTYRALSTYLGNIRTLPNESAKRHRFTALIGELFPGTTAPIKLPAGIEKIIHIQTADSTKYGRID